MQNGLAPAIVSLSILMIIFMIYDTKEKINNLQSNLFNSLTYSVFTYLIISSTNVIILAYFHYL